MFTTDLNMKIRTLLSIATASFLIVSCSENSQDPKPELTIPSSYASDNFEANTAAESAVIDELLSLTSAANQAEADAQTNTVAEIPYPPALSNITLPTYKTLVDGWLVELVKSANDDDGFQNPGLGNVPEEGEEGGLLGTRLLDENGLELEQMIEKGSFGAALYNHALTIIEGGITEASVDQLLKIHGMDTDFNPSTATAAAKYAKRRSNRTTETGAFYTIKNALLKMKAAIAAGEDYTTELDEAIETYLLAWEESNFATVIFYCESTKNQIQNAGGDETALGDALHAYAEGVAFTHGFKGLSKKKITDTEIDDILSLLQAPEGEAPKSFEFLNNPSLLNKLDEVVDKIQAIYDFSDEQVNSFFVNDPE